MNERKGRFYELSAPERDRQIVALRNKRWTHARIGKQVGMSESGVRHALERIAAGGSARG